MELSLIEEDADRMARLLVAQMPLGAGDASQNFNWLGAYGFALLGAALAGYLIYKFGRSVAEALITSTLTFILSACMIPSVEAARHASTAPNPELNRKELRTPLKIDGDEEVSQP